MPPIEIGTRAGSLPAIRQSEKGKNDRLIAG